MGQTVSIVNETNVFLHVSLKHIGPVFYRNYLAPGQRWTRKVPLGWYTVEAKLALSNNEYTKSQVAKPIIACTAAGIVLVGVGAAIAIPSAGAAAVAGPSTAAVVFGGETAAATAAASGTASAVAASATAARAASVAARVAAFISARKVTIIKNVAGFVVPGLLTAFRNRPTIQTEALREHQERLNKISLSKMGVAISKKTNRFIIRGGPPSDQVNIHPDLHQEIITEPDFGELDLVIVSDDSLDSDALSSEQIELANSIAQVTL